MTANPVIDSIEHERLALQAMLDAQKDPSERNRLGQYATPTALAVDMLRYAASLLPEEDEVRFLDPAIGTGAFYSALRAVFSSARIRDAYGFEIDDHYGEPASRLWAGMGIEIIRSDFTLAEPLPRFNLTICNPPYVRHHHIESAQKARLQGRALKSSGMKLSGLAGLYCYFMGIAHEWMSAGGVAGWLIPSEFMDVNYGAVVKKYLLDKVTLLHIHRFDPSEGQFADALVSSAVVWFRNTPPPENHTIRFTLGGTLLEPKTSRVVPASILTQEAKWTRFPASDIRGRRSGATLSEYFQTKRGIATGDNAFFILSAQEIAERSLPMSVFRPILPSPRYVAENEIFADVAGIPTLERRLFLLDTRMSEHKIAERYPSLFAYLQDGRQRGIHEGYICRHRTPWYAQDDRPPAPIVCTYLGRGDASSGRPFRFILNHSTATVANVYLALYPKPLLMPLIASDKDLLRRIWEFLNRIDPSELLGEGRVYGGGLHKLEPRELAKVNVSALADLLPRLSRSQLASQMSLFGSETEYPIVG